MRKRYIIDYAFQPRLALELVAILVLVPIGIWINFYIFGQYALIDSGLITNEETSWGVVVKLLNEQWLWVFGLFIFSVVVTGFCLVVYTHRVAGPVYKITQIISMLASGNLIKSFSLRRHDYLASLAGDLIQVESHYRDTILKTGIIARSLKKKAEQINAPEVLKAATALEKILDRYTVSDSPPS